MRGRETAAEVGIEEVAPLPTSSSSEAAAAAALVAAQRHSIQARLFPLSSMMDTSVETIGEAQEFINSSVEICHTTTQSWIRCVKLPPFTLSVALELHY